MSRASIDNTTTCSVLDVLGNAFGTAMITWWLGYVWYLLADMNTWNAILMLTGLIWFAIGALTGLAALIVWAVRHVRITII